MAKETKRTLLVTHHNPTRPREVLGKILDTGDEVNEVRGRAARDEGAGAIGLQRAAAARSGRYDKEALWSP